MYGMGCYFPGWGVSIRDGVLDTEWGVSKRDGLLVYGIHTVFVYRMRCSYT